MIGGYAQQSYGFNYYGTIGTNRDEFVIVRKMAKVDWMEGPAADQPQAMSVAPEVRPQNEDPRPDRDGAEPRQVHRVSHVLGDLQERVDQPRGMEYAWFNNVETKPGIGYPKEWENQQSWNGGWRRKEDGRMEPRKAASGACSRRSSLTPTCPRSTTTTSPSPSTTSTCSGRPRSGVTDRATAVAHDR